MKIKDLESILDSAFLKGRNVLTEPEAYSFLKCLGIDVPNYHVFKSMSGLTDKEILYYNSFLNCFGTKLAIKIVSPDILHKTEVGGIIFVDNDFYSVLDAYDDLMDEVKEKAPSARLDGILVMDFIEGLNEERRQLLASVHNDKYMGPVLTFGQGGVFVELDKDVASRIIPVDEKDIESMFEEVKISDKIFGGYRGLGQLVHKKFVTDFLNKLSIIAHHYSELNENKYVLEYLEINPLAIKDWRLIPIDCLIKFRLRESLMERKPNLSKIHHLMHPRNIAVIGASPNPKKLGHIIFKNVINSNLKVYPVNIKGEEVLGYKAYKSVSEIGEIDLALVTIPAEHVLSAIEDLGKNNVKSAILIPSGFGEINEEGKKLEEKIKDIANRYGMRIVGPNSVGVKTSAYNTIFIEPDRIGVCDRKEKNVAILTQSGAIGVALTDMLSSVGIKDLVSYGNMLDVDSADLIGYFGIDKGIKVISLYAESVKNARKFYETVKNSSKPIIVLKAGRCKEAINAASSHTGAIADNNKVLDLAFKQAGVIIVENIQELLDYTKAFSFLTDKPVKGNNVFIMSNGGGSVVSAADEIRNTNLILSQIDKKTREELEKYSAGLVNIGNPLDLSAAADNEMYINSLKVVLGDENVDSLVLGIVPHPKSLDYKKFAGDLIPIIKQYNKPTVAFCMGGDIYSCILKDFEDAEIPAYTIPERAVRALDVFVDYKLRK